MRRSVPPCSRGILVGGASPTTPVPRPARFIRRTAMNPNGRGPDGSPSASIRIASSPSTDDARVASALAEYLAELEAGKHPSREEFLARDPEIAEALDGCIDVLEFVHS